MKINKPQSKQDCIALAKSKWWKDCTAQEIVRFQMLNEERLCMDFGDLYGAVEKVLGRPVLTHEFASTSLRDECRAALEPKQ